ncbi:MAG TPA: GTP 3',8-cyclase MoaA [Planctomycetota bacterium]|nr:GTP 3',8-cyclase MoaA [Planctomycetota bacterium]
MERPILRDAHGRQIRNLRISVTDRCNFRCIYCMPKDPHWMPHENIMTFEEIVRFARIAISTGIEKIRLTGGEPTARKDFPRLVAMIAPLEGLRDLSVTTNGMLLKKLAQPLWDAGLRRINVSLDTLKEEKFVHIARRDALPEVMAGIEEARRVGFSPLKINMVVMRNHNEDEVGAFARLSREGPFHVRYIEFMPLDGDGLWSRDKVVPAQEILDRIRTEVGDLETMSGGTLSDPARVFRFKDGRGDIGVIASLSEPFCFACDRIRITADGKIRTCLFSHTETDVLGMMRGGADDATIAKTVVDAVWKKEAGHGINDPGFLQPKRAMYAIGG